MSGEEVGGGSWFFVTHRFRCINIFLKTKFKDIPLEMENKIKTLPAEKLEELAEAIFDFKSIDDVNAFI